MIGPQPSPDQGSNDGPKYSSGVHYGECAGCDIMMPLGSLGLCGDCAAKLDRDLIRQRDWAYSVLAFGAAPETREKLRSKVITEFGKAYELLAADDDARKKKRRRRS